MRVVIEKKCAQMTEKMLLDDSRSISSRYKKRNEHCNQFVPEIPKLPGCKTPLFSVPPRVNSRAITNQLRLPATQFGAACKTSKLMW